MQVSVRIACRALGGDISGPLSIRQTGLFASGLPGEQPIKAMNTQKP